MGVVNRRLTSFHVQRCLHVSHRMTRHQVNPASLLNNVLADGVLEVVGPAAHDLAKPDQHVPEVLLRRPASQGRILAFTCRTGRSAMKV